MRKPYKHDVVVSIQGCRFLPQKDGNRLVELMADGTMEYHRNATTVSYREPFDEDGAAVTTLLIEKNRVTMLRHGAWNTQMVFEEGRRHISYYDTAEGSMTVGVTASHVEARIGDEGGHIEVVYGVEIDDTVSEESHVSIDIHAASGSWTAVPDGLSVYRDMFMN